jgi:hypothetical protein
MDWHSIGHARRIFSWTCILLVTRGEYSHGLAFYWQDRPDELRVLRRDVERECALDDDVISKLHSTLSLISERLERYV